jgi:5-deoxy-glucuronate isomerase
MYLPDGTTGDGIWSLAVTPKRAGWEYTGLRVLTLPPGGGHEFGTGEEEMLVVPLAGSASLRAEPAGSAATVDDFELAGRASVFAGVSDFCYLPRDCAVRIRSDSGGRFALPSAPARRRLPARYGPASGVPVELRGAGSCSRQVNNIASADSFECDRLLVVEVLTPGGNWSSYPPHKHDEQTDRESVLEEIYYFEVAGGGVGYQRVYASSPDRPIDVLAEVRTGDVVLVPYGWHGPSMAAPGYDLYYLNAMAGPGAERVWRFCDDPAHGWVRDTWPAQPVDPRLPMFGSAQ